MPEFEQVPRCFEQRHFGFLDVEEFGYAGANFVRIAVLKTQTRKLLHLQHLHRSMPNRWRTGKVTNGLPGVQGMGARKWVLGNGFREMGSGNGCGLDPVFRSIARSSLPGF